MTDTIKTRYTFDAWRAKVNQHVEAYFGIGLDDLPDLETYDLYDDGYTPSEAADLLIEEVENDADFDLNF